MSARGDEPRGARWPRRLQVVAGRERLVARPGEDGGPRVVVVAEPAEGVVEFGAGLRVDGVEHLRPVDRDQGEAGLPLVGDVLVAHGSPPGSWRRMVAISGAPVRARIGSIASPLTRSLASPGGRPTATIEPQPGRYSLTPTLAPMARQASMARFSSAVTESMGVVIPASAVGLNPGTDPVGVADQQQLIDQLLRDFLERLPAVAGPPGVPHRLEHVAPPQPPVELGVDGDVEIGGDLPASHLTSPFDVVGRNREDPGDDLGVRIVVEHIGDDLLDVVGGQPVDDGPVTLAPGQLEHPGPQGRDHDLRPPFQRCGEAEPPDLEGVTREVHLLAGQRLPEEPHHVAHLLVGLDEGHPVPLLHDDVARRPHPEEHLTRGRAGQRRRRHGDKRRAARIGRDDRGAQPVGGVGGGRHHEWGEGVGPGDLGGPQVGEAGALQPVEHARQLGQLGVGKGDGQSESGHRLGSSL